MAMPVSEYVLAAFSIFITIIAVLPFLFYLYREKQFGYVKLKGQKYKSLFKNHPDGIFILNDKRQIINLNPAATELTGYEKKEIKGRPFSSLVRHDGNSFSFQTNLPQRESTGAIWCSTKNGGNIFVSIKSVPLILDSKTIGEYLIVHDLTKEKWTEDSLTETNGRLESFLANTKDAVNITDLNGNVLYMNASFEKMYGWKAEELLGKPLPIIPDELKKEEDRQRQELIKGKSINIIETQFIRKDGAFLDVSVTLTPLRDANQKVTAFTAITRDETLRKKAEIEVREQEAKYRLIAENSDDLIRMIDAEGIVKYASPSHEVLLGYKPEELEGSRFDLYIHPEDQEKIREHFFRNNDDPQPVVMEYRKRNKKGEYIWVEANTAPVLDDAGKLSHYIVVSRDVSEKKEHKEKLEFYAYYDSLTGVPNRRYFQQLLEETLRDAGRTDSQVALLFLDFDRFKWVNDTMGHDIGDELLKLFVQRIQAVIRPSDVIGRLGGDEFMVVLPQISSREDITMAAERLINALQEPWKIQDHEFVTTSSIGISVYPLMADRCEKLISQADQALYKAKESGRNMYQFFTADIEENYLRMMRLEEGLKSAVINKEFQIVYQPQVNVFTGETHCLEVLLRYHHTHLGLISPAEFIPIAERLGIIDEITTWIIAEAGKQFYQWMIEGYHPVKFSINLSPVSIKSKDFTTLYSKAIKEAGISPEYLELEITEQAFLNDLDQVAIKLQELKKTGVSIALDDFGSGYSSLSYFRQLPIDKIKIDRVFIHDINGTNGRKDKAIIQSIMALVEEIGMECVCEGVERADQVMFLKQNRCQLAQGYYYYKPMTANKIKKSGCISSFSPYAYDLIENR
ncbi:bifunctional diguanylate cyclase/phosphodiesterase [Bacillus sp. ISL-55]|uniref:sensor domain-containing protein n=1 Tax=Bacillus sp. ISL-55 TaxID=2819134 RepID=UPI001BE99EDE|nr:bifunctional diguanylate cyclase/phosphodiesterase [Bacillus sp. ISL-55]MBT2693630.1 PAS domain S-box protein [Bacillus sp. ISL-55]